MNDKLKKISEGITETDYLATETITLYREGQLSPAIIKMRRKTIKKLIDSYTKALMSLINVEREIEENTT